MFVDWGILDWIQETRRCSLLDALMPLITTLGNGGAVWIVIALVLLVQRRTRPVGVMLLVGLALGAIVGNGILKPLIARERPCWIDFRVHMLIPTPQDYSFPSGHTLSSSVAATVLFLANYRWGRWAIPLAALIAFSRLYLFVHFPSDILAGALIGIGIGVLVFDIGDSLARKLNGSTRTRKGALKSKVTETGNARGNGLR